MSVLALLICLAPQVIIARESQKPSSDIPAARAHIELAWKVLEAEMTLDNLDKAVSALEKAAKADPQNPGILVELSNAYFHRGRLADPESNPGARTSMPKTTSSAPRRCTGRWALARTG